MSLRSSIESNNTLMQEPLISIKKDYITTHSYTNGITTCHLIIHTKNIKKLMNIAFLYRKYSKINKKQLIDTNLIRELFYYQHTKIRQKCTLILSETLKYNLIEMIEIFESSPLPIIQNIQQFLPFQYVDPIISCRPINDIVINIVSPQIVLNNNCCSPFSIFSYILNHKDDLKYMLVDMTQYVYKIKSTASLILPIRYYSKHSSNEREFYERIIELGLS